MRPIHIADLDMLVRYLLALPVSARAAAASQVIARADIADRFRKRLHRAHDAFGTGTLAAAIPRQPDAAQPARCDAQYLAALAVILDALQTHQIR